MKMKSLYKKGNAKSNSLVFADILSRGLLRTHNRVQGHSNYRINVSMACILNNFFLKRAMNSWDPSNDEMFAPFS